MKLYFVLSLLTITASICIHTISCNVVGSGLHSSSKLTVVYQKPRNSWEYLLPITSVFRLISYLMRDFVSFWPTDGWRTLWQKEIDSNKYSSGSLVLIMKKFNTDVSAIAAVLLDNSTLIVPGNGDLFKGKIEIWIIAYNHSWEPTSLTFKETPQRPAQLREGSFAVGQLNPMSIVIAAATPSKPALLPERRVPQPPVTTNCSMFSFQQPPWAVELTRLEASVISCEGIIDKSVKNNNSAYFCTELEVLEKEWPEAGLKHWTIYKTAYDKFPKVSEIPWELQNENNYPLFCQKWWGWGLKDQKNEEVNPYIFAGFARFQKMLNASRPVVVVEYVGDDPK